MTDPDEEQLARERLAHAFPDVPVRIISSVFTAYREVTPTLPEAVSAAHHRIVDACAL